MGQYKIMLHSKAHEAKPEKYGSFKTRNQLSNVSVSLTELAESIKIGRVFYPSVHTMDTATIKAESFVSQQIIAVDFDNSKEAPVTKSMEEHIASIKASFGIDVALAYKTQSHTDALPKFRFLFVLDHAYTSYSEELYNGTYAIYQMFNNGHDELLVDTTCNDASRLFNGGLYNASVYVNESAEALNLASVIESAKQLPLLPSKETQSTKKAVKASSVSLEGFNLLEAFKPKALAKRYKAKNGYVPAFTTAYSFMAELEMDKLFDMPIGVLFLDVFHEEVKPSAIVYRNEVDMFNCFSSSASKKGYTIPKIIEEVHGKTKAQAFIKAFVEEFGFKSDDKESDLKAIVASNKAFVKSARFSQKAPEAFSLFSKYRFGLRLLTVQEAIASRTAGAMMTHEEKTNVFFSLHEIVKATFGTRAATNEDAACELMAYATLTGFAKKHADVELTEEALTSLEAQRKRTAERIGKKEEDVKRLTVYSFTDLASLTDEELTALNEQAKEVLAKGTTVSKMSIAHTISVYGEETAREVYPTERIRMSLKQSHSNFEVQAAVEAFVKENGCVWKAAIQEQFAGKMSRRHFDTAYMAAVAQLGLETNSATDEILNAFEITVSRRTKVSYYADQMAKPAPQVEEQVSPFLASLIEYVETSVEEVEEIAVIAMEETAIVEVEYIQHEIPVMMEIDTAIVMDTYAYNEEYIPIRKQARHRFYSPATDKEVFDKTLLQVYAG